MSISNEHVQDVCKKGQGADCCKYLGRSRLGWECLKVIPAHKALIDLRIDMHAKGDNCEGVR